MIRTGSSMDRVKERMQPSADTFLQNPIEAHVVMTVRVYRLINDYTCFE